MYYSRAVHVRLFRAAICVLLLQNCSGSKDDISCSWPPSAPSTHAYRPPTTAPTSVFRPSKDSPSLVYSIVGTSQGPHTRASTAAFRPPAKVSTPLYRTSTTVAATVNSPSGSSHGTLIGESAPTHRLPAKTPTQPQQTSTRSFESTYSPGGSSNEPNTDASAPTLRPSTEVPKEPSFLPVRSSTSVYLTGGSSFGSPSEGSTPALGPSTEAPKESSPLLTGSSSSDYSTGGSSYGPPTEGSTPAPRPSSEAATEPNLLPTGSSSTDYLIGGSSYGPSTEESAPALQPTKEAPTEPYLLSTGSSSSEYSAGGSTNGSPSEKTTPALRPSTVAPSEPYLLSTGSSSTEYSTGGSSSGPPTEESTPSPRPSTVAPTTPLFILTGSSSTEYSTGGSSYGSSTEEITHELGPSTGGPTEQYLLSNRSSFLEYSAGGSTTGSPSEETTPALQPSTEVSTEPYLLPTGSSSTEYLIGGSTSGPRTEESTPALQPSTEASTKVYLLTLSSSSTEYSTGGSSHVPHTNDYTHALRPSTEAPTEASLVTTGSSSLEHSTVDSSYGSPSKESTPALRPSTEAPTAPYLLPTGSSTEYSTGDSSSGPPTKEFTPAFRPSTEPPTESSLPATGSSLSEYSPGSSSYEPPTEQGTSALRPSTEVPTGQYLLSTGSSASEYFKLSSTASTQLQGNELRTYSYPRALTTGNVMHRGTNSEVMDGPDWSVKRHPLGAVINASCSPGEPLISWRCEITAENGAAWTVESVYDCIGNEALQQIAKLNLTNENVLSVLSSVVNVSTAEGRQFGIAVADVEAASHVLTKAVSLVTIGHHKQYLEILNKASDIVSQLLMAPAMSIAKSATSSRVSLGMERLLSAAMETLEPNRTVTIVKKNFAVKVTSDHEIIGIQVYSDDKQFDNVARTTTADISHNNLRSEAVLYFSGDIKGAGKSFAVYHNSKLFQGKKMRPMSEKILSAQLSRTIIHDKLVTIHFKLSTDMITDINKAACGFWSYADDDWSTFGCTTQTPIFSWVVCTCNHTTNFAVLMSTSTPTSTDDVHHLVLTVITRVGLSLSIALLLFVVVSYLFFRKLREGMTQKVLFQLSLSILLLNVTFLAGIDRVESRALCIAFTAMLHLFVLSSFAWMCVEALMEYVRFTTFPVALPEKYHIYAAFPAWGLPAVVVAALLAIDASYYDSRDKGICWVKPDVLHYGVFLPIALSIAFNGIMFALITRVLIRITDVPMMTNQPKSKRRMDSLKGCVSIFVLMGLTWVFGYLAVNKTELVFHYLFCIFNTTQGAAVALFHSRAIRMVCRKSPRTVINKQKDERLTDAGARCRSNSTSALTSLTNQATSQV